MQEKPESREEASSGDNRQENQEKLLFGEAESFLDDLRIKWQDLKMGKKYIKKNGNCYLYTDEENSEEEDYFQ